MPFRDVIKRVLGTMTGIEVIGNKGMTVRVSSVDYMMGKENCCGFESFSCESLRYLQIKIL
jgi:hypothetical protein